MPDLNRLSALSAFEKLALVEALRTAAHTYRLSPDASQYTPDYTLSNGSKVNPALMAEVSDHLAERVEDAAEVQVG
jgi:hypothetical protein